MIDKLKDNFRINVFDPIADQDQKITNFARLEFNEFCIDCGALIIMNNNPQYASLNWDYVLKMLKKKALVIDGWNVLERFNVAVSYDLIFRQL